MKKTKLIPANIKSKKELAQRMLDGEVFVTSRGNKIYFNPETTCYSPFTFYNKGRDEEASIVGAWDSYKDLFIKEEVEWYEEIPEQGVLCWHRGVIANSIIRIMSYDSVQERAVCDKILGASLNNLTPLTEDEIKQFLTGG